MMHLGQISGFGCVFLSGFKKKQKQEKQTND